MKAGMNSHLQGSDDRVGRWREGKCVWCIIIYIYIHLYTLIYILYRNFMDIYQNLGKIPPIPQKAL